MANAVLFDVDGTLVSFTFDVVGTRKAIYDQLVRAGFDTSGLADTTPTQFILDAVRKQAESGKGRVGYAAIRKKIYSLLDRFEDRGARDAIALPGVMEALLELQESSLLGVVTNSGRKAATAVLRTNGLLDLFDIVLTRDEVPAMKPRPEGILKAVSSLSIPKRDSLYVGDSIYDVLAAREAGVTIVSVSSGNYDRSRLLAERPDFVVSSLKDVVRIVKRGSNRSTQKTDRLRDVQGP